MKRRYFDFNATAPPVDGLQTICAELIQDGALNPSSVHNEGRLARAKLERARRQVASALNVESSELRFTSGATEAIHDFMEGFLQRGDHVVASPVEHPAIYGALERAGADVTVCDISRDGVLEPNHIQAKLTPQTRLVVVMMAQNEFGTIFPIADIVAAVSPLPVFVDAVQAFGKVPLDLKSMGVKGASVSGHKIGGLSGCGVLWYHPEIVLSRRTLGGAQEGGERGGTENLLGAVAMGHAASQLIERLGVHERLEGYQSYLEQALSQVEGCEIVGQGTNRLSNTTLFRVNGVPGDLIVQWMDMDGFSVSTGSACSSGSVEPSPTLIALGLSVDEAREGVRISTGPETEFEEVELLAERLLNRLKEFILRKRSGC